MNLRALVVMRRTLATFARPKLLLAFLVPYTAVAAVMVLGVTDGFPEDLATLPLRAQEQLLTEAFATLSFVWAIGIPILALVGVLAALAVAGEIETRTLRILLSKPIRRWEVLAGKFLAMFLFTVTATVASALVLATLLFVLADASPAAVGGSLLAAMVGNVAYALFVALVVGCLGTAVAVGTGSRLKTAVATLVLPAAFFGFLFVRLLTGGRGFYTDYSLYYLDLGYHFGNAFVLAHETVGAGFTPSTQSGLVTWTGVYDVLDAGMDPLVGGMSESIALAGYVPPLLSVVGAVAVALAALGYATRSFQRADVQ